MLSAPWSEELSGFYMAIGNAVGLKLHLERIERELPEIAKLLKEHSAGSDQDANDSAETD